MLLYQYPPPSPVMLRLIAVGGLTSSWTTSTWCVDETSTHHSIEPTTTGSVTKEHTPGNASDLTARTVVNQHPCLTVGYAKKEGCTKLSLSPPCVQPTQIESSLAACSQCPRSTPMQAPGNRCGGATTSSGRRSATPSSTTPCTRRTRCRPKPSRTLDLPIPVWQRPPGLENKKKSPQYTALKITLQHAALK